MSIIMAGCIGYICRITVLILLHGTSGKHDEGILASISMTTQNVNGAVTQQLMRSIFRFESASSLSSSAQYLLELRH